MRNKLKYSANVPRKSILRRFPPEKSYVVVLLSVKIGFSIPSRDESPTAHTRVSYLRPYFFRLTHNQLQYNPLDISTNTHHTVPLML